MSYRLTMLTFLTCSIILIGCASNEQVSLTKRYETLPQGLQRNAKLAQQLNGRAIAAIDEDGFDTAEELLKEALSADVTFGPAHNNLGSVYLEQERYYLAAWEFEYAIRLMPSNPAPKNNLGLVFEAVGKTHAAIDQYAQAAEIAPDDPIYLGNEARARLRAGEHGPEVRMLLQDVVLKDERQAWQQWARKRLVMMPKITPE